MKIKDVDKKGIYHCIPFLLFHTSYCQQTLSLSALTLFLNPHKSWPKKKKKILALAVQLKVGQKFIAIMKTLDSHHDSYSQWIQCIVTDLCFGASSM